MPSLFFFTTVQAGGVPFDGFCEDGNHYCSCACNAFYTVFILLGAAIRQTCGMTDPLNGPYYDPSSEREEHRRVILLLQAFAAEDQTNLEKLFDALTKVGYKA